jgi:hypothetical protein
MTCAWTTSDTTTNTLTMTIDPSDSAGCEVSVIKATVTGNFTFTTPEGITYHLLNVTVTEPGFGPTGPVDAVTWRPHEQPIGKNRPQSILLARPRAKPKAKPVPVCSPRRRGPGRCQGVRVVQGASTCTKWHRSASRASARGAPVCALWVTSVPDGTAPIDAKADPKAAAAAMALFPAATNTAVRCHQQPSLR